MPTKTTENAPAKFAALMRPIEGESPAAERVRAFFSAASESAECVLSGLGVIGGSLGTLFIAGPVPSTVALICGCILGAEALFLMPEASRRARRNILFGRFCARSERKFATRGDAEDAFEVLYGQWLDLNEKGEAAREWMERQEALRLRAGTADAVPIAELREAAEDSPMRDELLALADAAEGGNERAARLAVPVAVRMAMGEPTEEKREFLRKAAEAVKAPAEKERRLSAEMRAAERALGIIGKQGE